MGDRRAAGCLSVRWTVGVGSWQGLCGGRRRGTRRAAAGNVRPTGAPRTIPARVSRVVVITGPSGVGKGTLIRLLREQLPELGLSVSATTRAPRPGEADGVDYRFLSDAEFDRLVADGAFVEHAEYAGRRYGTLRSELEARTAAGEPVVLEIEVQGAAADPRRDPRRAAGVHRPAVARGAARAARRSRDGRRPTSSSAGCASPRRSSRAQEEFAHVVVNDRLEDAVRELVSGRADGPGRPGRLICMIQPRIDTLLEQVDSNYAAVLVAAKRARQINSYYHNLGEGTFDEFPPPMVDSHSKNYLTIALEEVAGGKIAYHYR